MQYARWPCTSPRARHIGQCEVARQASIRDARSTKLLLTVCRTRPCVGLVAATNVVGAVEEVTVVAA